MAGGGAADTLVPLLSRMAAEHHGVVSLFAFYPVLMQEVFGVVVWQSSSVFALAVGLRLLLYAAAGH